MEFESFQDIVDFAIEKEKEAKAFYEEVSEMESLAGYRELFKEFAAEEAKHVTLLESIGKKGIEKYKFKWIPDLKRSNFLVDIEYEKGMGYKDMLHLAIKREEKALALYNDLQDKSDHEELKNVFKVLCQEEAKHKLKLETLFDDYMAEMGD
jgi:rubrerythrin